jgi:hypothetical protein
MAKSKSNKCFLTQLTTRRGIVALCKGGISWREQQRWQSCSFFVPAKSDNRVCKHAIRSDRFCASKEAQVSAAVELIRKLKKKYGEALMVFREDLS